MMVLALFRRHDVPLASLILTVCLLSCRARAEDASAPSGVVATFKGHTETVYSIAFSPDGRHVLTGSFDKTVRLWEAATGKEIKSFGGQAGHQQNILSVAFSPDGRYLASGSQDNSLRLWDSPLSGPQREYAQGSEVNALALSPDGARLAGAGKDGSIKVWNAVDGKQLLALTGHSGSVTGVAFGSQQFLGSCGVDGTVRLWDIAAGKLVTTLGAHATPVHAVQMLGNNTAVSAGDDGLIKVWRVPTSPARSLTGKGEAITAFALSQDGAVVVSGGEDKAVRLAQFSNGQQMRQFAGATAAIRAVDVSANRSTVAAGTADGKLLAWNAADGKLLAQRVVHTGPITSVSLHPQGIQALTGDGSGQVKVWNLQPLKKGEKESDKPLKAIQAHRGDVTAVLFHSNGAQALSAGADRTIKLWNVTTGQEVRGFGTMPDAIQALAFSRDYTQIGAAAGSQIKIWSAADGKEVAVLNLSAPVTALAFSPDRSRIVAGGADKRVHVCEVASGKELEFFPLAGAVQSVAFHPDNRSILCSSASKTVEVYSLALTRLIIASAAPVRALAVTPGGSHVLAGGDDKTVKLWNIGNGANERTFSGPEGAVTALAIARNGVLLAVGGADKSVRLYTFADAKQRVVLATPAAVRALVFSPNQQSLASAGDEKIVSTWNVPYNPGQPEQPEFGKPGQSFAQGATTCMTFSPDGTGLYAGGMDRTIKAWKPASDQPLKNLGHPNYVDALVFNSTSTQLASGCHDGIVRIWDVAKGQMVRQIAAHTKPAVAPVYCVAWSPDGKQLVSGSFDHSLKLWDAATGNLVREFKAYKEKEFEKGHRDGVYCASFSPDGKFMVSGGSDRALKIWNVASGEVVRELVNPNFKPADGVIPSFQSPQAHPGPINSVCFTPDGARLVSAGGAPRFQSYLAVWLVADGKLLFAEQSGVGTYHAAAMSSDGRRLALACGPRGPGSASADVPCFVIRMPEGDKKQTTQAKN